MPPPSILLKYLVVFVVGAVVLSGILYVYMILGAIGLVWTPWTCLTDMLAQTSNQAGHYFEVSQTSCSGIGKGPAEISVFASKGRRGPKALIFKYERMHDGSRDAEPTITTLDDRTIRISVRHVAMIICRSGRWDALAVEYDIGRVVDEPDGGKPPGECARD
jgi:hypothetical protein